MAKNNKGKKTSANNPYEKLSQERKKLQAEGKAPQFFTTASWQIFKAKYLCDADTPLEQYRRIANTAAKHMKGNMPRWWSSDATWEEAFFDILWSGVLSPSTPVLANTGTDRGLPVSCSGNVVEDSINGFYKSMHELAVLTKNGFGTASYLGNIRPRGAKISSGGEANGIMPVIKQNVQTMRDVSQGNRRRGAWAAYVPIEHGDFDELVTYMEAYPDDLNIGWCIGQSFIDALNGGDVEAQRRYGLAMRAKMITGRGYFAFIDKINALRPPCYIGNDLEVVAPQLCNEIHLHSDTEHTYTCVLSSMNMTMWDVIKTSEAVFVATVFLDCIAQEFIEKARGIEGLEKAVRFTEKGRSLGLGACGMHTYLQQHMIPAESIATQEFNIEFFQHMQSESLRASQWLAGVFGEPEWCKGYGVRNTHRTAVAPTKTTAAIMGGISEGINFDPAMSFSQLTAAGEVDRANPTLLQLMKDKGIYDEEHFSQITDKQGSVQHVDWLTPEEKEVFKTAFEINQRTVLSLASARQMFLCQGQSLNVFFASEETEEYISEIMQEAFEDPFLTGIYYCYSKAGVAASKGSACEACQ